MAEYKFETLADLNQLISNLVPEGKNIEYKQEIPSKDDGGSLKILKSISAFANTNGGFILYGIEEEKGIPKKISGLKIENQDEIKLRVENLCRDGLEPPLTTNLSFHYIPMENEKSVLAIKIRKSYRSPHRIKYKNHGHFYARNSAGNYPLDVGELRKALGEENSINEKARSFIIDRLSKFEVGETPIPINQQLGKLIVHIVPVSAIISEINNLDLNSTQQLEFTPPETHGPRMRRNLDGFVWYANQIPTRAFAQIFRNGIVESFLELNAREEHGSMIINSVTYENNIYDVIEKYLSLLLKYNIEMPFLIYVSILNVDKYQLNMEKDEDDTHGVNHVLDRKDIFLPPIFIEKANYDMNEIVSPIFNLIFNAFGYIKSSRVDINGKFSR
ncbi:MAG: ATP-binding protein [Proteobacteria bacterium]|nr:ATP-binding protein [Pseudomonadota bacterium]